VGFIVDFNSKEAQYVNISMSMIALISLDNYLLPISIVASGITSRILRFFMKESTCMLHLCEKWSLSYTKLLKGDLLPAFRKVLGIKSCFMIIYYRVIIPNNPSYFHISNGFTVKAKNRVNISYMRNIQYDRQKTYTYSFKSSNVIEVSRRKYDSAPSSGENLSILKP
jgi:hypothetical protein